MRKMLATLGAAAVMFSLSVGCSSGDDAGNAKEQTTEPTPATTVVQTTEPTPSTEPTTTVLARADVLNLDLVGCDRFGIGSLADSEVARSYVPDSYELWLLEESALFTLQTMRCDDLVTDGVSHGPGHFGTAWVRIVGPDEAVQLPPESDLVAQPTDTFYVPLFHTDNDAFHAATVAFGMAMTRAESMTFDPPTEGTQTGAAVDLEYSPPLSYRWTVDNINRNDDVGIIGLHNLMSLDDQGDSLTYYGEFVHDPGWWGNVGTLELESGSAFEDLIGTSVTGPVNGDPVTIQMVVFRDNA
jgi:hypothetical protein